MHKVMCIHRYLYVHGNMYTHVSGILWNCVYTGIWPYTIVFLLLFKGTKRYVNKTLNVLNVDNYIWICQVYSLFMQIYINKIYVWH